MIEAGASIKSFHRKYGETTTTAVSSRTADPNFHQEKRAIGSAPRIVLFKVYSAFTRVTAGTLALSPYFVTRYPKASAICHLHSCSGCLWPERFPGRNCTHWKSAAFSRARQKGTALQRN
jgi:hypothetical protein